MQRRPPLRLPALLFALASIPASCEVGAAPPGEPVVIYLDGSEAIRLEPGDVRAPLDICRELGIAPESVRYAELRAPGETPIRVPEPRQRYPKRILAAFPATGGVGAGWVDMALGELPAELLGPPPVSFAPATEVRLRTLDVERVAAKVKKEPLRVLVGDVELLYTDQELAALPHVSPAQQVGLDGGRQALAGAPIRAVVADALARAGRGTVDEVAEVVLRAGGEELRLSAEDLGPGATRATSVKRNRKGLWRLKLWVREGDRLVSQDGLRGLDAIEVRLDG